MHAYLSFIDGHLVMSLFDWWISELSDTQGLVVAHGLEILHTSGMSVQYMYTCQYFIENMVAGRLLNLISAFTFRLFTAKNGSSARSLAHDVLFQKGPADHKDSTILLFRIYDGLRICSVHHYPCDDGLMDECVSWSSKCHFWDV